MAAHSRRSYITPEEYLRREREAIVKSEYWDGVLVAMAGGTEEHERISGDIYTLLNIRLRDTPCEPFTGNMSVRIPAYNRYVYPDVSVACDAQFDDVDGVRMLTNPVLVVEVLSKSTALIDLTSKKDGYRTLPSLATYVVVSQDTPRIEVFTRLPDSSWRNDAFVGQEATLSLPVLQCELPLSEIYRRVRFAAQENEPFPETINPSERS
jgi:Uma2 family endonuclease